MLLKTIEHEGMLWDAYVSAGEEPTTLEVVFLTDPVQGDEQHPYAWPIDGDLLLDLLREPLDVRDELLTEALVQAINNDRRSLRVRGPVRLL